MKRRRFAGLALAAAGFARPGRAAAAAAATARSLWIWHTPLAECAEVAAFARRYGFGPLFLSVAPADRPALAASEPDAVAAVRSLTAGGTAVFAVAGDPSWIESGHRSPPPTVATYLSIQRSLGLFSGLAIDLEPHALPLWHDLSEQPAIAKRYLAQLDGIRGAAAARQMPVLAAVHPTYAKIGAPDGPGSLLEAVVAAVDQTDLMAYRTAESSLESFAGAAMEQLAKVGKPWWLGVSTHPNSPSGTSYAGSPSAQFLPAIGATAATLSSRYGSSLRGIAVEDYHDTRILLAGGSD